MHTLATGHIFTRSSQRLFAALAWTGLAKISGASERLPSIGNAGVCVEVAYRRYARWPSGHNPIAGFIALPSITPRFTIVRILVCSRHPLLHPLAIIEGAIPSAVLDPGDSGTPVAWRFTFSLAFAQGTDIPIPGPVVIAIITIASSRIITLLHTLYLHYLNYQGK